MKSKKHKTIHKINNVFCPTKKNQILKSYEINKFKLNKNIFELNESKFELNSNRKQLSNQITEHVQSE